MHCAYSKHINEQIAASLSDLVRQRCSTEAAGKVKGRTIPSVCVIFTYTAQKSNYNLGLPPVYN